MKKIVQAILLTASVVGFGATGAWATPDLYDWAFNIDGTFTTAGTGYDLSGMPVSGTLDSNDLGTLTWSTSVAGSHSFLAFFDYEIDDAINTYFNESGGVTGTAAAGQSWEVDDPWYGDIRYWNIEDNTLDNTNSVAAPGNDVSWAMGWDFTLDAGETASITLSLTDTAPVSGFYLSQLDPDSQESIYFAGNLSITGGGGPAPVPEPATMLLFGTGLAGLWGERRKTRK